MPKFFVNKDQFDEINNKIIINGQDLNHIVNVLRLKNGDEIFVTVKQDQPKTFLTCINEINSDKIICNIENEIDISKESNIEITIYQGIPKSDKMELIIQKCTEIGVSKFVPLELSRCIAKIEGKDESKKITRWQKIAEVASKQCGRDKIPEIMNKVNIKELCNAINEYDCVLVAYEQEENHSVKEVLNNKFNKIAIAIGPEGGFDESEIDILKKAGAHIISLGKRILRTETAPIVLSSIIMYELGEF